MEIKYGGLSWRGDQYANVALDIEALNELKAVVEDRITDYGRLKNYERVREEVENWNQIMEAIREVTPEPIPAIADEAEAIPVKWLLSLSDSPRFTDNFRNCVDGVVKLWREGQEEQTDEEA